MSDPTWPPADWQRITTLDSHTEGEPFRVITGGLGEIPGRTILERRRWAREHLDSLRTALMWEPRGHADMYGGIVMPPVSPGADLGVLFVHNEGFSTMCGHGVIALTTVVLEAGLMPKTAPVTTLKIDTPAGLITSHARIEDGRVKSVAFHNVPSFVLAQDQTVEVPGLGEVRYHVAFGGAFYAYVDAAPLGLGLGAESLTPLIDCGRKIKQAVMAKGGITHPVEDDLSFLYGVIFVGAPRRADSHSRNVCIFADGEVDRSPTGTGVSGRLALHHARGELEPGEKIVIESVLGSRFTARVVEETTFGPYSAIIPEVSGRAHLTGRHEFLIDPEDDLRHGFLLR